MNAMLFYFFGLSFVWVFVDFLMLIFWMLSAMLFTLGYWQTAVISVQEMFWLIGALGVVSASFIVLIWSASCFNLVD